MAHIQAAFDVFLLALARSKGWDPKTDEGRSQLVRFIGFPEKKVTRWLEGGQVEGACRGVIIRKTGYSFQIDDIRQAIRCR